MKRTSVRLRILAAGLLAALVTGLLAAVALGSPEAERDRDRGISPLEQAREESGVRSRAPKRYDVPAGQLSVTPSELLAAQSGQTIRFSVNLARREPGAALLVTLPKRWVTTPVSGIPTTRGLRSRSSGGARARVGRAGRTVELAFSGDDSGVASFELTDVGIPAGTYKLPFSWRDASGRVRRAGTAKVVLYIPSREASGGGTTELFRGLAAPGLAMNVTNDSAEESETFLSVTPNNPDRVLVGVNGGGGFSAWISNDGGQAWTKRTLPTAMDVPGVAANDTATDLCCDPISAADSAGNLWYGGLSRPTTGKNASDSRIFVNRIAAGGTSFNPVTTGLPSSGTGTQDKPMMTIDNGTASPTYGRLYVVWDEPASGGDRVVMSFCDTRPGGVLDASRCDNSDNWSARARITGAIGSYIYADVAVAPDGRVYVVWWDFSSANAVQGESCLPSVANTSCGVDSAWTGAAGSVAIMDSSFGTPLPFQCDIVAQPGGRASTSPQIDIDHSGGANNGRVYVTWSDLRPGSGTTKCDSTAPDTTQLTFDSFVASAAGALPGGATPSDSAGKTKLHTDGEDGAASNNSDDWFAWLAVDQSNGDAWADFYSTRDDTQRKKTNFYARQVTPSGSSGQTVGTLTKVSAAQSDYSSNPCCGFGNDYGDYTGIDAAGGIAYPVWSDKSSGDGEAFAFVKMAKPTASTSATTSISQTGATLNGSVNPRGGATTYRFEYGTDATYGTSTTTGNVTPVDFANHSVSASISGLSPATEYHFKLVATNAAGTTETPDATFTTSAPPGPSATTQAATGITDAAATLKGTANNANGQQAYFEYGPTTGYGTSTPPENVSGSSYPMSATVSLAPNTTYHFRLAVTGGSPGADLTFRTKGPPTPTTNAAQSVTQTSASLRGSIDTGGQSTTWHFERRLTSEPAGAYVTVPGGSTVPASPSPVSVSSTTSGLSPATSYTYRLVAGNASSTVNGNEVSFTTQSAAPPAPTATTGDASGVTDSAASLAASVNANGSATSYRFDYGTTAAYGSSTPSASAGSGSSALGVSQGISGLSASTTYHYRVVATSAGGTVFGSDRSFTTGAAPPVVPGPALPPKLTITLPAQTLARALKRGVRYRVRCDVPCRLDASILGDSRLLRRAAAARLVRFGRTQRTLTAPATVTLTIKFTRAARRALARRRSVRLRLRTIAVSAANGKRSTSTLTLRLPARLATARRVAVSGASSVPGWALAASARSSR